MDTYDYIVVGAGSAGCVVATMLTEKTDATVLLLEAGSDDNMLYAKMPAGMPQMMASHVWKYRTEPEPGCNNHPMEVPQGKVMGGGSSVNGMAYVRGVPEDYEDWKNSYGCSEWGYDEVLKAYIGSENNEVLSGEYHGRDGHQYVSEAHYRHPLTQTFMAAAQEMGYPYTTDFNGKESNQDSVGFFQTTTHNGRRASTSYAWLRHVRNNPRITIKTGCLTEKILIEDNAARGVMFSQSGKAQTAYAKREIVVSAGAIGSPKILQLSGIGPREMLEECGVDVVLDSPNVGANFQDHLHINLRGKLKEPISILKESQGLRKYKNGLQWLLFKTGPVTSSILEGCGFFDLDGDGRRETQIHTFPLIENFGRSDGAMMENLEGFTLKLGHVYPASRGKVVLRSANPQDLPKIYGNYLTAPGDLEAMMRAVKFGLTVFEAPSMQKIISEVITPDADMRRDDAALAEFVKDYSLTVFHPVGTCAMGGAEDSVLDQQLRVRGIANLRVIDASAFPHITSGNTNAPVIMLAYRAAQMMLDAA